MLYYYLNWSSWSILLIVTKYLIYNTKISFLYCPYDYYENTSGPENGYVNVVFSNELKTLFLPLLVKS